MPTSPSWKLLILAAVGASGCQTTTPRVAMRPAPSAAAPNNVAAAPSLPVRSDRNEAASGTPVARVSYETEGAVTERASSPARHDSTDDPFAVLIELPLARFVDEVQARNPTLQAAVSAWAAAAERCPQVVAFDDPMLQSMFAPASFSGASNVQSSYYLGIAQKIPFWGKRGLRGANAQSEANALAFDSEEVRLRLAQAARVAWLDYYLVARGLELNRENRAATSAFRDTATAKYEASQVTQQDVLQAEVEIARLDAREVELVQRERVARARINTLLHRPPDHWLPPAAASLDAAGRVAAPERLVDSAVAQRPELSAMASRIQAEQAALALACREFYPDVELMGRYDRFWFDVEQRAQIGLNVNLPLNVSRRNAAVRESQFRLGRMQAEYEAAVDAIRESVQSALAMVEGRAETVRLYLNRLLPASSANVESANAGYIAGTVDFLRLVEAQREQIRLKEEYFEALTEYHRGLAELDRVVGAAVSLEAPPIEPAT